MKALANWLELFLGGDRRSEYMKTLAKTEYGNDWEYAYHCLMNNKKITLDGRWRAINE